MEKFQVLLDDELQKISGGLADIDSAHIARYGAIGLSVSYTSIGVGCLIASRFAKNPNRKSTLTLMGHTALAFGVNMYAGYICGKAASANEPERFGVKNN